MTREQVDALYRTYGPAVLRRARAILGDETAARDAMQEVFVRVLQSGDAFRKEASPMTWLYRITTNFCLNTIRDGGRRAQLLREQAPPPAEAAPPSSETRAQVAQILGRVPEELREIAVYYFVDQMSHDEIAALIGVSRRTVGNRVETFLALAQVS